MSKRFAFLALAATAFAACGPDSATGPASYQRAAELEDIAPRAVYTLTNQVSGNAVAVFTRAADGTLTAAGSFSTGGTGTGAGLGSQGAVALSRDGRLVFAVNAGSNDVSVLRVGPPPAGLSLLSRTASGGTLPISVTTYGNIVYVLNAGGAGNITGFTLGDDGNLAPIAGSTRAFSGAAVGPAQVSFSPDGRQLVVTEKNTSLIDVYPVGDDGVAGQRQSFASAGGTPFGFAFGPHKELLVSEASAPGSASSYTLNASDKLRLASGVILTHQGAPCWAVVTGDGRLGYTGNGSGSVSGFNIAPNGSARLFGDNGATAVISGGINDIALSANSRYLYALGTSGAQAIYAFRVESDGRLTALGPIAGLPAGTRGLAAF